VCPARERVNGFRAIHFFFFFFSFFFFFINAPMTVTVRANRVSILRRAKFTTMINTLRSELAPERNRKLDRLARVTSTPLRARWMQTCKSAFLSTRRATNVCMYVARLMARKLFDIYRVMSRNSFDIATVIFLTSFARRPSFAMMNTRPTTSRTTDLRSRLMLGFCNGD